MSQEIERRFPSNQQGDEYLYPQRLPDSKNEFEKKLKWQSQRINLLAFLVIAQIVYIIYLIVDLYEKINEQAQILYSKEKDFNSQIDNTVNLLSQLMDYLLRLKYPEGFVGVRVN